MSHLFLLLAAALLATIVLEWGVLLLMGERRRRVWWAAVVLNVLTNVPLNLFVMAVDGRWPTILLGESLVVLVEWMGYGLVVRRWSPALVYSVLCNAVSFLVGVLCELVAQLA